jgi:beta-lactamase class A
MMRAVLVSLTLGFCSDAFVSSIVQAQEDITRTAEKALSNLPGQTAFAFTEIRDGRAKPLYEVRANERLAVGSSFKLYIFGTLIEEVNAGRRRMDNTMLLRSNLVGPPSSEMGTWPMGSPVTLHTLALKMISISDNTATDHLLYLLGRERVEAQFKAMGHGDLALNRPLISTREMVTLRDKKTGMPGRAYQQLDEAGRRVMLAKLSAGVPDYEALDFDTTAYQVAEWYASPLDMAQALAWIYEHTKEGQQANDARGILAVDPKLPHDAKRWPYVGFKGGSEDQVLAGNWLLENQNGHWYTMHVYCNSPQEKIDPQKLVAAVGEIFAAIEASMK